jgi:hypothetical protein
MKVSLTTNDDNVEERYYYDGLDRLVGFRRGTLDANFKITGANLKFRQDWGTFDSSEERE